MLLALAIGLALTPSSRDTCAARARPRRGGGQPDSAVAGAGRGRTRRHRARCALVHRQPPRNRPFRRSADERHCSGAERTLIAIAPTIRRELYSLVDFSRTRGIDLYPSPPSPFTTLEEIFGLLGLLALVVGGAWGIGAGRTRCGLALGAGAALVVVLPAALVVVGDQFLRVWHEFWLVVGRPAIAEADSSWQWQLSADPALSWFGPLAASLLIVGTAIVARETWRRQFTPVAVVLAAALSSSSWSFPSSSRGIPGGDGSSSSRSHSQQLHGV